MIFQNSFDLSMGIIFLLAGGVNITYFLVQYILDPLRDIPGPFLARFTRLWYFLEIYKGSFEKTDIELHKKYGPIVRIAPREYSIDGVGAVRTIYGHGTAFVKAPWYSAWMPPDKSRASLFSDLNPHRHATQRRKFSSMFTMSSMINYEPFVNNCATLLCQRFYEIARSGKTIDLGHWLQCYAFDVIGEITFAKRFGFLDRGEDKEGMFQAIETKSAYGTFVGVFPSLHKWLYPMLPDTGGFGYVFRYALRQIRERERDLKDPRGERGRREDIMNKILDQHNKEPARVTRGDLATMCLTNIGAGSDTTAIALSSILYHLIKNPTTYQKLQQELDVATKEGKISDPVSFKQSQDLPYLQAVIKEGIRIHPSNGLPMARVVPKEGTTISGRFFPGGSTVGINAWVASRNTSVFGTDADKWRPERWQEIEEQGRNGEAEKYSLEFGAGSRTCLGKNISLLEISTLIPQLVRRFDFELDEGLKREGMRSLNRWFVKQVNFKGMVVGRVRK